MIFLPGTDKQLEFLLENRSIEDKNILIAGTGTTDIAAKMMKNSPASLQVITDNDQDIINTRMRLASSKIPVKMMDYRNTDYKDYTFDIIYSQGTFAVPSRRKIFKEMLRILKPDGLMCIGEVIASTTDVPKFVKDIWETSEITPLTGEALINFYKETGLEVAEQKDLSYTLRDFYKSGRVMLSDFLQQGSEQEKIYYKKLLNKISHESNAYLNLGGSRYMEFHAFILKRSE